jgi:hypothetical protein
MSLSVPPVGETSSIVGVYHGMYQPNYYPQVSSTVDGRTTPVHGDSYKVRYDTVRQEIILEQDKPCPIHRGDWIVLTTTGPTGKPQVPTASTKPQYHARISVM